MIASAIAKFYIDSELNMQNMIISIVREFHWDPITIGSLFIDNKDEFGIEFWYEDIMKTSQQLKS